MAKRFAAVRTSVTSRYSFSRLTHAWFEFLASDPGHMRFRSACRATLSGALTGTLLGFLVVQRVIPAGAVGSASHYRSWAWCLHARRRHVKGR